MRYNEPYGGAADAPYVNGDPSVGLAGSIPPAASIEYPQREIVELIADAGLTPTNSDLKQLAKGVQNGKLNVATDAGTVNALQATLAPVPVYALGLVVRIKATNSNTGPSTLNLNALGPKPILRKGQSPILANDIQANSIATLVYNDYGTGHFQLIGVGGSGARGELTANKNLYVNYAIGNDANDGTANDAAHAVKNIQRAVDIAFFYAPSQYTIFIFVADSPNYVSFGTPTYAGPNIEIVGNSTNPENVLVTGTSSAVATVIGPNTMTVSGIKSQSTDKDHFVAANGANLFTHHTKSGSTGAGTLGSIFVAFAGTMHVGTPHSFQGDSQFMFSANLGGYLPLADNAQFTISNAIDVVATVSAAQNGSVAMTVGTPPVFINPSNVTGSRYTATLNGTINTQGSGASFFPGTTAGSVATGGQYV